MDCVEPARLEDLLELSARTSAANSHPYKDNLSFQVSQVLQGSPSLLPRWARSRR